MLKAAQCALLTVIEQPLRPRGAIAAKNLH